MIEAISITAKERLESPGPAPVNSYEKSYVEFLNGKKGEVSRLDYGRILSRERRSVLRAYAERVAAL